jgi:large subunit ribosomal protein L13
MSTGSYCRRPFLDPLMPRNVAIQKTFSCSTAQAQSQRRWYVIDAADQILGQVAQKAANLIRGKEKPIFTPHIDTGDFVVVINAEKVRLTGKKETQKSYMSFSGYVGGHKSETVSDRRKRRPTLLIEKAVWGMIPKNRLGRRIITKLKVYAGSEHPHAEKSPVAVPAAALS